MLIEFHFNLCKSPSYNFCIANPWGIVIPFNVYKFVIYFSTTPSTFAFHYTNFDIPSSSVCSYFISIKIFLSVLLPIDSIDEDSISITETSLSLAPILFLSRNASSLHYISTTSEVEEFWLPIRSCIFVPSVPSFD